MEDPAEQGEASAKKGPFDGLDRDELISKLKGLLSVYKNAKQSKEELAAENAHLKDTLAALQLQKTTDKEHLRGVQASLQKLNETVAILEEQKQLDKNYMKGMHEMVEEVTNEKNSLSNRVSRLAQENEQLLGDCRKTDSILRQLNDSLGQHQQQVQQLQHMCEQQKAVNTDLRKQHASEVARNDQLAAQLTGLQTKCSAHENKIKLYRTKLVDFSGQLKELRMCKEVLLTTVREYSQAVIKWQGEILTVSNNFFVKNRVLQDENRLLEERLSNAANGSCGQCAETMQKYEELVVQFEKMVQENFELGTLVKDIENRQPTDLVDGNDNDSPLIVQYPLVDESNKQHNDGLLEYRTSLTQLDDSLLTVQNEINRLQNLHEHERILHDKQITQLEAVIDELQSKLKLGDQNKILQDKLEIEIDTLRSTLASREVEMQSAIEENHILQAKLTEINSEMVSHTNNAQKTANDFQSMQAELESLRNIVAQTQSQLCAKDETEKQLELKLSELEYLLDSLRVTSESNDSERKLKEASLQEALLQIAELETKVISHQNLAQISDHNLQTKKTELDNELESLRSTVEVMQSQISLKDDTQKELESKISELKVVLENLMKSLQSIQSESSIKDAKLSELQAQLEAEVMSHRKQSETDLNDSQSKQADLDNELTSLKTTLASSQAQLNEMIETHKAITEKSQSNLEIIQIELSKAQSDLHVKEEANQKLNTNIVDLKSEVMSLRNNLASNQAQINAKEKSIHTLETTIANKDATITENAQQLIDLKGLIESVQSELATCHSRIEAQKETLSKNVADQTQHEQTLTKMHENMKAQHLELSASKMCVDDLRTQLRKIKEASTVQETNESVALQQKFTELTKTIENLKLETSEAQENLTTAKSTFETALRQHETSLKAAQKQFDEKSQRFQEQSDAIQQLRQDSTAQIRTLEQRLDSGHQANAELQSELKDAERKMTALQSQYDQLLVDKENVIQSKQMEMDELLSEMRELNEALRNRGDIISKQEQKIAGLNAELSDKMSHVERLVVEHEQLNEKLREADSMPRMHDLSDQLSTSTVSRIEEISRMRDVDDSFEEKYTKLRSIAVRLKKKISEQTKRIEELEKTSLSAISNEADTSTSSDTAKSIDTQQLRNLQQLQKQNDTLQDELEELRLTDKRNVEHADVLTKQLMDMTMDLTAMKEANANIKSTSEASSNQKASLDQAVKEYVKQISALKEELTSVKKEKDEITDASKRSEEKLQSQTEELSKISSELKKVKSSVKKNNVMNLEMEAQEKTLIDISQKLEAKGLKIDELNLTIAQHDDTISSLRHQIRLLEETVDSEKDHAVELKQQLDIQQARLHESEHNKSELKIRIDELQQEKTSTNAELIECRLQASQSSEENEKCITVLRSENERHLQRIAILDTSVSELTQKLRSAEHELQDLKTEFVAYKVRAQSMLRQNQQKESSREVELEDELSTVQSTNETLNNKLKIANEQYKCLEENLADQRKECERQQDHSRQLLQLVEETRLNVDSLQEEVHRQNVEHQKALKAQRLQIDTLNECYKKEIFDLVEKHERDIDAKSQQLRLQDEHRNHHNRPLIGESTGRVMLNQRTPPTTDEQRIDWLLTERQDAEGSESTITHSNFAHQRKQSTSSRGPRDLIPLDELLNNSFDMSTTVLTDDGSASPTFDQQATKDKLNVQESRVRHLTTLLAEAEQDTARLTQLNDALKEEVRRQERSAEREQHLHNLEYLKNVMFKFLTINQGDEKAHLVPVLNTMLKLSPEETQKLQNVAKGGDSRGWRGYLPV